MKSVYHRPSQRQGAAKPTIALSHMRWSMLGEDQVDAQVSEHEQSSKQKGCWYSYGYSRSHAQALRYMTGTT
jgi:hypothetical protein